MRHDKPLLILPRVCRSCARQITVYGNTLLVTVEGSLPKKKESKQREV